MALHATSLIRVALSAILFLSPPIFAILAIHRWKRSQRPAGWKAAWPIVIAAAVLVNWVLFVAFLANGQIGGFGSHYMTTRLADGFLLVSVLLLVASIFTYVGKWQLSLASALTLALWVGSEMVA
jgi:hypothetical protein